MTAEEHELERLRPASFAIAYRMLGSVSEAEDVVQEALLRVHQAIEHGEQITFPRAYVATVTTRLAINELRSARARREQYVGEWLPEPILTGGVDDPAQHAEMADSLSLAMLVLLESLSPEQRAALLLHDVFDYGYPEIAEIIGKSEDNVRQLASRDRRHVEERRPRFQTSREQREELARRFLAAAQQGDLAGLEALLAHDVVLTGDGGGKVPPRVVIRGGAGTGKTLLAAADAERTAVQGASVLFVCQSNALRDELRSRLCERPRVKVFAFQELCGHLMRLGGIDDARIPGSRSQEYFDILRPTSAMEGWAALGDPPQWDVLIVDEAQDLLTGPAAELLELLVEGGWDDGRWRLFLDPVQDLFAASHSDVVDRVSTAGFRVRLSINCRNSAPIARDTAIATGGPLNDTLAVHGPEPVWHVYSDRREHRKLVGQQIRTWIDQGFRPQDITILSPVRRMNSVLADGLPAGTPCSLVDGPLLDRSTHPKAAQFSTVAAFKGLESDAVLLLDAPHLGRIDMAATVYVGMTRARAVLSVLRDSRYNDTWRSLQQDFGKRLITG